MLSTSYLVLVALLATIALRIIYLIVYNVYFHPLSKFAGPWSAAATTMPFALRILNGHIVPWTTSLHKKYGEVVRISPDELSFANPSAWRDIYGHRPQLPKAQVSMGRSPNGVLPIIQAHVDDHTRQRKIISPAFSDRALREQEYILHDYTDLLISRLRDRAGSAIDICEWCQFTTFDIMGDLCFGESFGCLVDAEYHPWLKNLFGSLKFGSMLTAFQYFPPMDAIVRWCIPEFVRVKAQRQYFFTRDKITKRIERKTDRPDFMSYILQNNEKGYMSREEINASVPILLLAGSDSSALTSTAATFYLMQNPQAMKKLREEIDSAFASSADITVDTASGLPYLHAVLSETLRLFPATPSAIPREVISGGVTICGQFVPEGTRVGIPVKTAFRFPQNFVDPELFVPERWLKDADPRFDADRKDMWEPFAYGPRNCLGKPLAWAEMNMIMTKLIWNFEFERAEGFNDDWTNQKVFLGNQRTPLMVRLRSRVPQS